jgi:hypothetical protein
MDKCSFFLKLSLLPVVAVLMMASSVEAQRTATNAEQSIVFSSPANNEISSDPKSLPVQPASSSDLRSLFQDTSATPSFNNFAPAPAPIVRRRLQKSSNGSGDWVFMTPAEIMGVAPDQILQSQNGSMDQGGSLTPMERYFAGQSPSSTFSDHIFGTQDSSQNSSGSGNSQTNGVLPNLVSESLQNLQSAIFGQSLNTTLNNNPSANANDGSIWSKLFGAPTPRPATVAVTARQQADMDQFQQLLNPGSMPVTAATTASDQPGSSASPNAQTVFNAQTLNGQTPALPDFDSGQPLASAFSPAFAPLSNSKIGQPPPVSPLPGISQPASAPSITPAWAPQSAPWMSQTPQPFAIPQRKF